MGEIFLAKFRIKSKMYDQTLQKNKSERIIEIDVLRGAAVLLMILHHLIFDLRYIVGLDVFAFQESIIFQEYVRPIVIGVFIVVSGISCRFSRNNLKRSFRMIIAAILLTLASLLINFISGGATGIIIFNVFHVLAVSMLFYAILERAFKIKDPDKSSNKRINRFFILLLILAVLFIFLPLILYRRFPVNSPVLKMIFFADYPLNIGTMDSMPLFPWLGFFFLGAALSLVLYRRQKSLFPQAGPKLQTFLNPFAFMGRYALWFYIFHQPLILALLWFLGLIGILPQI